MKAYPQHLMSRLTLLACRSDDIPGTPDSLRMLVQELDAVFPHVLSTLDAPTKFILDTVLGLSSQEKIKDVFPEAKKYMFWSPSASCLYTMLGEHAHSCSTRPLTSELRRRMAQATTRRSSMASSTLEARKTAWL